MVIAQVGNAGGTSLILMGLVALVLAIVLAYWVYNDAGGRGNDTAIVWAAVVGGLPLVTIVGGIIAFVVYILIRE